MNLDYFKDPYFKTLFETLKTKYVKTSSLTGSILLNINSSEEASKTSRLINQNVKVNTPIKIKIKDIERSLAITKYADVSLLGILKYLYPQIKSNKEKQFDILNTKNDLMNELKIFYAELNISNWFNKKLTEKEFYQKTIGLLTKNKNLIYNIILALEHIINSQNYENLSVFSSLITGFPHYFDLDNKNSGYLSWYLAKYYEMTWDNSRATKIEIFNRANIYLDMYSNLVITFNFWGAIA